MEEVFQKAVKKLADKNARYIITSGKATDIKDGVCRVIREGLPDLLDIRLNAVQSSFNSYLTIVPADKSDVQVALIENGTEGVVIATSEIEKLEVGFANDKVLIDKDGVSVNLDKGKLTLKNKEEDLKKVLEDILTAVAQITVPTGVGPSGVPVNAASFTQIKTRLTKLFN